MQKRISLGDKMKLNEAMKDGYVWHISANTSYSFIAKFISDDESYFEFNASKREYKDSWKISFFQNHLLKIKADGDNKKIENTILDITKEFIKQVKPKKFIIQNKIIYKYLKKLHNYEHEKVDKNGITYFVFKK